MKKLTALLMAASLLILAGCGNDEKVMDGSGQNSEAGASGSAGSAGTVQGGKGYVFTYKGTTI